MPGVLRGQEAGLVLVGFKVFNEFQVALLGRLIGAFLVAVWVLFCGGFSLRFWMVCKQHF